MMSDECDDDDAVRCHDDRGQRRQKNDVFLRFAGGARLKTLTLILDFNGTWLFNMFKINLKTIPLGSGQNYNFILRRLFPIVLLGCILYNML